MGKYSIAKRLALGFAAIALVSTYLTSFVSNFLISRQFNHYLSAQREERETVLIRELETAMSNGQLTEKMMQDISSVAMADHIYVRIYNANGLILWQEGPWRLHHNMMGIGTEVWSGPVDETSYSLTSSAGQKLGQVVFGYVTGLPSAAQVNYAQSIWLAGILSAAAAGAVGATFGWWMSLLMSRPLRDLTSAIESFRDNRRVNPVVIHDQDEIGELTLAFADLKTSLEQQESQRRQLTADVAHELRTPLSALRAQIEAMQDGVYETSSDRLSACHREVMRLTSLVDDVENLASIEAAGHVVQKRETDIAEIVHEAVDGYRAALTQAGLAVTVETQYSPACVDPGRIRQVVLIILSNGLKYLPRGSTVEVRTRRNSNTIVIEIEDNGKGIPEDDLPYIFERFYRADKSRSRISGGAGLGLAIAKAIVEAHSGRITAGNRSPSGARFLVELPTDCAKEPGTEK